MPLKRAKEVLEIEAAAVKSLVKRLDAQFTKAVDVLADRHSTTRGAVYKVLHDARRKLRAALRAQGWDVEGGEGSDERTA